MTDQTNAIQDAQQTALTVQDLTLTLQVIQVATSRGAFKADELSAIGGLYDRIFKFLEASGAIQVQQPAPQEQAPQAAAPAPAASPAPAAVAAAKKKPAAKKAK